jgi:hypothetical protein
MEGRFAEIYLAACGKDDVKRQWRLAEFPAKLCIKLFGFRIDECGNAHVPRVAIKRKRIDQLDQDAPVSRPVQQIGRLVSHAMVGGLHHQYVRI